MPVVVCSACQARINVKDELLGRKAKCPKCAAIIVLQVAEPPPPVKAASRPAPPPPVEDDNPFAAMQAEAPPKKAAKRPSPPVEAEEAFEVDDEDEASFTPTASSRGGSRRQEVDEDDDRPRRRRRDDDDVDDINSASRWSTARTGVRLAFISAIGLTVVMVLLAVTVMLILILSNPFQGPNAFVQVLGVVMTGLAGLSVIGWLVHFIGQIMCCWAPSRHVSQPAVRSLIFFGSAIGGGFMLVCLIAVAGAALQLNSYDVGMLAGISVKLIVGGLSVASYAYWVNCLGMAAAHFRNRVLQAQFGRCRTGSIAYFVLAVLSPVIAGFFMLAGVGLMAWYSYLLMRLGRLIDDSVT